jgi:hypothetical protein
LAQAREGEVWMKAALLAFEACGSAFVFERLLEAREAAG